MCAQLTKLVGLVRIADQAHHGVGTRNQLARQSECDLPVPTSHNHPHVPTVLLSAPCVAPAKRVINANTA
jgi:hypothetical protein